MLLLLGLAIFLHPRCFCLALTYTYKIITSHFDSKMADSNLFEYSLALPFKLFEIIFVSALAHALCNDKDSS